MQIVRFQDLGLRDYAQAWEYQTGLHRALVDNKLRCRPLPPGSYPQEHCLLLVEHPPVFTLGKSGAAEHLLLSEAELVERGIQYFPINRGGDITFHGPGQIVGYPILDLECFFTDVHRYVRCIEEVIIRTLAEYGVEAGRIPGHTGVWCPPAPERDSPAEEADFWKKNRKICAIGVHLSRWVTLHGFAFNVNTDLRYFSYIVPCGIADADKAVTSLQQELGAAVPFDEVKNCLTKHFCATFACKLVQT
ncbi:MAG: lipoyl(octanoyl) transferase LipB [Saprospiraceae bacterium]